MGGNGHWYESVDEFFSWTEANENAQDHGGYLATIISSEENDFIWNNVQFPQCRWLGGYKNGSDWATWVTGESWTYTNWNIAVGEPNNFGGNENYLQFSPDIYDGTWNDNSNSGHVSGLHYRYIIEYEVPSVPIPSAVWLLVSGLIGLVGFRRKFRDR